VDIPTESLVIMSSRSSLIVRPSLSRAASIGLIAALVAASAIAGASSARAVSAPQAPYLLPAPTRIQGIDRYDQAIQVSSATRMADIVYVVSGERFADALSTSAVAAHHDSPLLLTPHDFVPQNVLAELARLRPSTVVVVGGTAAVSDAAMEQLSQGVSGATVVRIDGADRYEVSRKLLADPTVGAARRGTIFAVTGADFPDALTATPAAVHTDVSPVLLLNGSATDLSSGENALLDELGVRSVGLVGGQRSVSAALETSLGEDRIVRRIEGADRFATGVAVNNAAFTSASTVYLASGTSFPDALSGGARAAREGAPLYVVLHDCIPTAVLDDIGRLQPQRIVILGGPAALGAGVDALTPC
jgi:putative cell wall-binding protein